MRRILVLVGVAMLLAAALCWPPQHARASGPAGYLTGQFTFRTCVLASAPTLVVRNPYGLGFLLHNGGPNPECCAGGGTSTAPFKYSDGGTAIAAGECYPLAAGADLSGQSPGSQAVWCQTTGADQTPGTGCTIEWEAP